MDYQIPWFVVEAVYRKHSNLNKIFDIPIHKLALLCFEKFYPRSMHKSKVHYDTITLAPDGFKHLLHIFHWSRSPEGKFRTISRPFKKMDSFYIPSASSMHLSETVFKKHADGSIDVSYSHRRLSGVMKLAPWHISEYSPKIYESLLRFERGYGLFCGYPFTAYVACMVCLLQTEEDVQLLRAKGIIPSTRNDEKEVLSSVKQFRTFLCDDVPMSNDLANLSAKVMANHQRSVIRYYGEFKSRYCSNPWITASVIAGICLFVLTFLQTMYGMLSYYKLQ
ncbi:uncharacterized protein LOC144563639 [Carex rostrata]